MLLEQIQLPENIKSALKEWGIKELFPPQLEVVNKRLVSSGNFVLAAPTASGKTLAAELAMLNELLNGGKIVYIVPLRALASEKFSSFYPRYKNLGFSVRISVGDYDSSEEPLGKHDVIITTYEKFDSILRHRASWIEDISAIIFDEIHYVADEGRGPAIEMTVAKFMDLNEGCRRIALSATIKNIDQIARWLEARPLVVDWRPVPLMHGVFYKGEIVYQDGKRYTVNTGEDLSSLILDCLDGGQVLIFYMRRKAAVSGAKKIARIFRKYEVKLNREVLSEKAEELVEEEPSSHLARELASVLREGVAFHHAGLSHRMRAIVEDLFRRRYLLALTATPTLAAGVNLPARRVIVASYMRYDSMVGYSRPISTMEFKQMAGRAGRPGYDEFGEALIIAKSKAETRKLFERYLFASPEPISSSLHSITKLRAQILSLVALKEPTNESEIEEVLNKTLFSIQGGSSLIMRVVDPILEFLQKNGMIERVGGALLATKLGKRVSQLYIDPMSAIMMVEAMEPANRLLKSSRTQDLELSIFQFIGMLPDMPRIGLRRMEFDKIGMMMDELEYLIPLTEAPLASSYELLQTVKLALTLRAWIRELSLGEMEEKFRVEPGDLHNLIQNAVWLIYSFSEIARLFQKQELYRYLENLMNRVKYGVKEELLGIVKIPGIGRRRGRILYDAGYTSLVEIARADVAKLASLPGIGDKIAGRIIQLARELSRGASSSN
ncbi:MAG TPA: DEAD/DEAH box helicase [Candidatus Korarchaeota archaeon]|nr:DEAD/DEAH box helicase [Candidatus Korarchaeota archaeon]